MGVFLTHIKKREEGKHILDATIRAKEKSMNAQPMDRTSKRAAAGQARVLAKKPASPSAEPQSAIAKSARLRETTTEQRHRVIAGAPYYRGLRWDF